MTEPNQPTSDASNTVALAPKDWMTLSLQLRDKHLSQLMETSGKAVIAVLGFAIAVYYSVEKIDHASIKPGVAWVSTWLLLLSVV